MSCSTTTTVCAPASDARISAVRSISCGVMPATGSSTRSSLGRCTSSMPISSHCFWPCESTPARRSRCSSRPMSSSVFSMLSRCGPERRATSVLKTPLSPAVVSSRFSKTVWPGKTVGRWNLRPMPRPTISCSAYRVMSLPSKVTFPVSGRVLPVMMSISVVLPAPFGPMMHRSSPASRVSVRSLRARKPSKLTVTCSTWSWAVTGGSPSRSRSRGSRATWSAARSGCSRKAERRRPSRRPSRPARGRWRGGRGPRPA